MSIFIFITSNDGYQFLEVFREKHDDKPDFKVVEFIHISLQDFLVAYKNKLMP